jgi:hypothetical protein
MCRAGNLEIERSFQMIKRWKEATKFTICFLLYFRLMIYLHFCKNKSEVQLIIDLSDDIKSGGSKSSIKSATINSLIVASS